MKRSFIYLILISLFQIGSAQSSLLLNEALQYIGTPYVAHTLETGNIEQLIINKSKVDCTTFVEYSLAQFLANQRGEFSEAEYLQKIRYRNGVIAGYPSRLHYITEWIEEGVKNGFIKDITAENSADTIFTTLSYMSKHPQYYKHLKNSKENQAAIKAIESELTGKVVHWLPKSKLTDAGFPWIQDGDIIALTVGIHGLDTSHMGIAIYQANKLHLLHASSSKGKVVIEPIPLAEMLKNSKNWTGIRVLRPLHSNTILKEETTSTPEQLTIEEVDNVN